MGKEPSYIPGVDGSRTLESRAGTLKLLIPQDREGAFSTRLFSRYQRNEKVLVLALMETYLEGVSTKKVRDVTEELCSTSFSRASPRPRTGSSSRYPGA